MKCLINSATAVLLLSVSLNVYSEAEPSTSTGMLMLQTLVGLMVVLLAIVGFAWLAKKIQNQGFGRSSNMSLISVLPLGTREKAVLIKAEGKTILLGVAPGRVSALHVFDESEQGGGEADILPNELGENSESLAKPTKNSNVLTGLAAKSTSEFSKKLQSFLGQGQGRA